MGVLSSSASLLVYVAVFAAAALACVGSLFRIGRIDDVDTRRGLYALLLVSGGWAASHVGFLVSPTRALKLGWYTLGLVLGLAAVGAWLYLCSAYTGRAYHRNPTARRLAIVVYLVLIAVKVTNPLHHAYFTTTAVAAPFPHLSVYTGPLHWAAMGLSYALAFVGYFMLVELFIQIDLDTRALVALVGITGLPVALDIIGSASPTLIDITYEPLGVAIFAVGVVFVSLDRFNAVQLAAERDIPVLVLDADGSVRDTNRTARALFPALAETQHPRLDSALPEVAECLDSDDPILELRPNGTRRYYRVTETPYGTAKAGHRRTIVFTDVTDRERYRRELERQNDRLDQFASMVSHDLRNPLNVAQGRVGMISAERPADEEHVAATERALARMDELITEILTLARDGQPVEQWDAVALSSVVEECWEMVETAGADIHVEADFAFEADATRLKQVFENLFRNAIDHGGSDVTITVGVLPDRTGFYVADDGPGIPVAERANVFTPGYSTRDDGTGFGLAIVSEAVAAHGWEIDITESATGGARFEITSVEPVE